jgi:hypothetical protein
VATLRKLEGVVDAEWQRDDECIVVAYLPGRTRSGDLLEAIAAAGYRPAADPRVVADVPAVYAGSRGPRHTIATPRA